MAIKLRQGMDAFENTVSVMGSFRPDNTSAPVTDSETGKGWSVARTSQGLFTVTLDQKYNQLVGGECSLQVASGNMGAAQFGDIDVTSGKTVQIRTFLGGNLADLLSDADNRVHFHLVLRRTSEL